MHDHWKEGKVQIRYSRSKEKQWTIMWHIIGSQKQQMLQIATHGQSEAWKKAADEFMVQLAGKYATEEATTKESMEKSKSEFLALS